MADKHVVETILNKQPLMRRVIFALIPCLAGAIYFFGWRMLAVAALSCSVAFIVEWIICAKRGERVSEAVFVTAILYALVLPPPVPWHVVIVGVTFAVAVTKGAFGGFGRNIFNPAVAGRCFVYVCFPVAMTGRWAPAAQGMWGALGQWSTVPDLDAITSATPMALMKAGEYFPSFPDLFYQFFLGRIDGTMGVTSALLIIIGGVYLLYRKTANRTTAVTLILAYALLNQALHWLGVDPVPPALPAVLGGGFLFGAFFMATDPVSSPKTNIGRVLYALLIAVCTVVIRNFSAFNGGLMFSILIGNMCAPILDHAARAYAVRHKGGS